MTCIAKATVSAGGGSGSFYGFSFDGTSWTLKKFDSVDSAYSLCTFIGKSH